MHQTKPQPETTQPPPQPKTIQQQKQPDAAQQANAVYDPVSGAYLKCRELFKTVEKDTWTNSFANELGRLSQGYKTNNIQGTNTLHFIPWNELPENKIPTYARICCDYRPHKSEKHRTRITVGGNRLQCTGDTATPTASITTVKMHLNSTASTKRARYCTLDIKDFYLNSNLDEAECMLLEMHLITQSFAAEYNLSQIVKNGKVLTKITKRNAWIETSRKNSIG